MVRIIREDLIKGGRIDITKDGITATRIFVIGDVIGNPSQRILQATQIVPQRGIFHPAIPDIQVDTISGVAIDMETIRVTVNYKLIDADEQEPEETQKPVIRIGGTTQTVITKDAFGLATAISLDGSGLKIPMEVQFAKEVTPEAGQQARNPEPVVLIGEAEIQIPKIVISFMRKEPSPPIFKALEFLGTVSSTTLLLSPPRAWLCTRLDGETTDGEKTWNVNYQFIRSVTVNALGDEVSGWDANIKWFDEVTGQTPKEVFDFPGEAIRDYQVAIAKEFRDLNLGFEEL